MPSETPAQEECQEQSPADVSVESSVLENTLTGLADRAEMTTGVVAALRELLTEGTRASANDILGALRTQEDDDAAP